MVDRSQESGGVLVGARSAFPRTRTFSIAFLRDVFVPVLPRPNEPHLQDDKALICHGNTMKYFMNKRFIERVFTTIVLALIAGMSFAQSFEDATTTQHAPFHLVIKEVLDTTTQAEWPHGYHATLTLFAGSMVGQNFRGSSLPNNVNPNDTTHQYSVLKATCDSSRVYTWKKSTRPNGLPCLRLAKKVPVVQINSDRAKIPSLLSKEGTIQFADDILVHVGASDVWRGSAGCITIDPKDADSFFSSIPVDTEGTLEVVRTVRSSNGESCW